jgi:hypothetical protein
VFVVEAGAVAADQSWEIRVMDAGEEEAWTIASCTSKAGAGN